MWSLARMLVAATAAFATVPAADVARCPAEDVTYDLAATLQLTDTPLGRGDGNYSIGPGRMVLRIEGRKVRMLSYTMRESFAVRATTLFWTTTVVTSARSTATPGACPGVADGILEGRTLHWLTPVRGYRTDGTITCEGSFCGKFGAPPEGQSPLHIGPAPQWFSDFHFAPDGKTFVMPKTPGQKTEMPKQTSAVTVAGREVSRACAGPTRPCRE